MINVKVQRDPPKKLLRCRLQPPGSLRKGDDMRKNKKRLISLLLVLVMAVGLLGVNAFAFEAPAQTKTVYETYTVLGDSIPTGYGIVKDADGNYWSPHGKYVSNAYPEIVEQTLGVKNFNIQCRSGFRTVEALRMIDPSVVDTWTQEELEFSDFMLKYLDQMDEKEIADLQAVAYDQIKNSDLITINLANNDILSYSSMKSTMEALNGTGNTSLFVALGALAEEANKAGGLGQLMGTLLNNGVTIGFLAQYMLEGFQMYMQNWNKLIAKIREINPDAKILAIGMYNPFTTLKLTDASLLEIGRLMDPMIQMVNAYISMGSEMKDEYTYVDVMGTQAFTFPSFFDPSVFANFTLYVHPTEEGHAYMADKILKALGENAEGTMKGASFKVNVPASVNGGTVTASADSSTAGKDVTVSVAADGKHDLDEITFVTGGGNVMMIAPDANGNYKFRMPSSDVNVVAKFKSCPSAAFKDLDRSRWYHDPVDFVLNEGIMAGVTKTEFAPDAKLTRGMIVQMLYAMAGKPDAGKAPFRDVSAKRYYAKAVAWAAEKGIVSGFEDGTFRPDDNVTREQLAVILKGYAGSIQAEDVTAGDLTSFPDGDSVSEWAAESVAWAVGAGLIAGRPDGNIAPTANASRAEVAQMLANFCAKFAA